MSTYALLHWGLPFVLIHRDGRYRTTSWSTRVDCRKGISDSGWTHQRFVLKFGSVKYIHVIIDVFHISRFMGLAKSVSRNTDFSCF